MDVNLSEVTAGGERVIETDPSQLIDPHIRRYEFAARFVRPTHRVLDGACGTGYGSEILSRTASEVVGIDISEAAIGYCQQRYRKPNLSFQKESVEEIGLPDASFDRFISFETIEHIPHPEKLVAEAWRLLKPGGLFLVSTPNRVATGLASGQKPENPYHLMEWSLGELDAILRESFSEIQYFGQRIRSNNKIHPKYIASKMQRWMGGLDILPFDTSPRVLQSLEHTGAWYPVIYLAICQKL